MSSFRILHTYKVILEKEVEVTETTEKDGQKITITKKERKPLEYSVILKEPSRRDKNELALFEAVQYGDAVKKGLITKKEMQQILAKRDSSNPLSESEDKTLNELALKLTEKQAQFMGIKETPDMSPDEISISRAKKEEVLQEFLILKRKSDELISAYQSAYTHTAENYAQTRFLTWLILFLSYVKDPEHASDSVPRPLFPGSSFESKEEKMIDMDDARDPLFIAAMDKLVALWSAFMFRTASTTEEFKSLEDRWSQEDKIRTEAQETLKNLSENSGATEAKPVALPDTPPNPAVA